MACRVEKDPPLRWRRLLRRLDRAEAQDCSFRNLEIVNVEIEVRLLRRTSWPTRRLVFRISLKAEVAARTQADPDPVVGRRLLLHLATSNPYVERREHSRVRAVEGNEGELRDRHAPTLDVPSRQPVRRQRNRLTPPTA